MISKILKSLILCIFILFSMISCVSRESKESIYYKLLPPVKGIYHSAYPDFTDEEDVVTSKAIEDFISLADKNIVWAYFSNNWVDGIKFPENAVWTIHNKGIIPFIRLMARSSFEEGPDKTYTLQKFINGEFDKQIYEWAQKARDTNIPLIIEFGTEVNGDWFPWCGANNGGGIKDGYGDPDYPDGPERFRDAYRHIINIFRDVGARNITWVFHVDAQPEPDPDDASENAEWNRMANYYPGDDYIDWIGISVYGATDFSDDRWDQFSDILDNVWNEFSSISANKPLAILEWGVMDNYPNGDKAQWITNALNVIKSERYPGIKAISYWNEAWEIEPYNGYSEVNLRIDSNPDVLMAYRDGISSSFFVDKALLAIE